MKAIPKTSRGSSSDKRSSTRAVITDSSGHRVASAPLTGLAPLRFHIGTILVPMDFSNHSRHALRYAQSFAEQFGARLCLLHVVEPVVPTGEFGYAPVLPEDLDDQRLKSARAKMQTLVSELGTNVTVEPIVHLGRAWKEIVETARATPADLLIISTHGYTGFKYALLGSVAEKIVRHAPCPVLVVRPEERDFI
ncbi:MAG TPA: universal stress protein [Verrucomicrobiota bacterium]|nr:universal stress protein [Verrucomicrobiales bacterium]HRI11384.1 universal stress protein [Verrucomicrobiota bacterium]